MMQGSDLQIPERLYFRIGDVADIVGVKPYVLRYWESEFPVISPGKSQTGQRVYRRTDVENILLIKHLLYKEKYSIEGARNRIRELRRDGELHSSRQEAIRESGRETADNRKHQQMRELADELRGLASRPITDFFRA